MNLGEYFGPNKSGVENAGQSSDADTGPTVEQPTEPEVDVSPEAWRQELEMLIDQGLAKGIYLETPVTRTDSVQRYRDVANDTDTFKTKSQTENGQVLLAAVIPTGSKNEKGILDSYIFLITTGLILKADLAGDGYTGVSDFNIRWTNDSYGWEGTGKNLTLKDLELQNVQEGIEAKKAIAVGILRHLRRTIPGVQIKSAETNPEEVMQALDQALAEAKKVAELHRKNKEAAAQNGMKKLINFNRGTT